MFQHYRSKIIARLKWCSASIILFITPASYATISLGEASDNIIAPLSDFNELIYKACYILGAALLCGSVVQYKAYRDNPTNVKLSQPILLLIFGLVIVFMPFIAKLSMGGSILTGSS